MDVNIEYIIESRYRNIYYIHINVASLAKCFKIYFRVNTVILIIKDVKDY